jgi:hypothetical protein
VNDHVWSATAVSQQIGAAVLLRSLVTDHNVALPQTDAAAIAVAPRFGYYTGGAASQDARRFQQFLNGFPGVTVSIDGKPGRETSSATKEVLGHYLVGDPRDDRT